MINTSNYSLQDIFRALLKWWKWILIFVIVATTIAVLLALRMPNYYKAFVTFFPSHPSMSSPATLGYSEKDRYPFGGGDDLDRMMTIADGMEVKLKLIDSFDLYTHYEIDSNSQKAFESISAKFDKLYTVIKTKYDAITISVEDVDPVFAASMCHAAFQLTDAIYLKLNTSSNTLSIKTLQSIIHKQDSLAVVLADSITNVKIRSGIIDSKNQGEVYSQEFIKAQGEYEEALGKYNYYSKDFIQQDSMHKYKALSNGLKKKLTVISGGIQSYTHGLSNILKLESEYSQLIAQNAIDKEKLKQIYAVEEGGNLSAHIVERVEVPQSKSRPKRSIIVVLAFIISLIFALCSVLVIESGIINSWKQAGNEK